MDKDAIRSQILEAWRTNNRINLLLIGKISADGMACSLSTRGGRSVARQFAHLHSNRVWHLQKRAADLAEGLHVFETADEPDKKTLRTHLEASARRFEQYWQDILDEVPRRRTLKKGVVPYLGYFIAHESHHRGNILLTLKQCGHAPAQDARYAIWDWDKI